MRIHFESTQTCDEPNTLKLSSDLQSKLGNVSHALISNIRPSIHNSTEESERVLAAGAPTDPKPILVKLESTTSDVVVLSQHILSVATQNLSAWPFGWTMDVEPVESAPELTEVVVAVSSVKELQALANAQLLEALQGHVLRRNESAALAGGVHALVYDAKPFMQGIVTKKTTCVVVHLPRLFDSPSHDYYGLDNTSDAVMSDSSTGESAQPHGDGIQIELRPVHTQLHRRLIFPSNATLDEQNAVFAPLSLLKELDVVSGSMVIGAQFSLLFSFLCFRSRFHSTALQDLVGSLLTCI